MLHIMLRLISQLLPKLGCNSLKLLAAGRVLIKFSATEEGACGKSA